MAVRQTLQVSSSSSTGGAPLRFPNVRASNEGSPRPRVARAQETFDSFLSQLHSPNEDRLIPIVSPGRSGQGCPLLRASGEHCFIVRVLRARRAPGHSSSIPSSCSRLSLEGWAGRSSSARVERAHSDRARSASRRTTRLPFPSHCWIAETSHFPSEDRMKVQASPDSVGVFSLHSTT